MGELYTCKDVAERYGVQIFATMSSGEFKKAGTIKRIFSHSVCLHFDLSFLSCILRADEI